MPILHLRKKVHAYKRVNWATTFLERMQFNNPSPLSAIVFVYDYHAGAETLAARHFSSPAALSASGWEGLVNSHGGTSGNSPHDPSSRSLHKSHRHNSGSSKWFSCFIWLAFLLFFFLFFYRRSRKMNVGFFFCLKCITLLFLL